MQQQPYDEIIELLHRSIQLNQETQAQIVVQLDRIEAQLKGRTDLAQQDCLTPTEACELLGWERHKLADHRENHWIEGVHYFRQLNKRYCYNGILLNDWLKNSAQPHLHQAAIDQWLKSQPAHQPRKPGRKRAS